MTRRALLASAAVPAALGGWTAAASTILLIGLGGLGFWSRFSWSERATAWWRYLPYLHRNAMLDLWIQRSALGGAAVIAAALGGLAYLYISRMMPRARAWSWSRSRAIPRGVSVIHGRARWATAREIRRRFRGPNRAYGGVVVGELDFPRRDWRARVPFDERNPRTWGRGGRARLIIDPLEQRSGHAIVVAGSGSYKTQSYVIPTLFTFHGSMVVLDPKCQLAAQTRHIRERMGHRVITLRPGALGLNVLDSIDINSPLADVQIWNMASNICYEEKKDSETKSSSSDGSAFYRDLAVVVVACVLADMLADPSRPHKSLRAARRFFCLSAEDMGREFERITRSSHSDYARRLASFHISGQASSSDLWISLQATVFRFTRWLLSDSLADMVSGDAFSTSEITNGLTTVYLEIDFPTLKSSPQAARALLGSLMNAMYKRGTAKQRTLFVIDEAKQVGPMEDILTAWGIGRERGIALLPIYLSLGDIYNTWGENAAQSLLASCSWYAFSAIADDKTAELVSKLCGSYTARAYAEGNTLGRSSGQSWIGNASSGQNISMTEVPVPVASKDDLLHEYRSDEQVVVIPGMYAANIGKAIAFRRPEMAAQIRG
jgi:type IV secretion system protein VirD4